MNVVTTHEAAGTYYPAAPGARTVADARSLVLNGQRISAVVDEDGSYKVFAGTMVISEGNLNGTEGQLMVFFAAEALIWSAGIDADMAEQAEVRAEAELAHRAEAENAIPAPATPAEMITLIETLGGKYRVLTWQGTAQRISWVEVKGAVGNAYRNGFAVQILAADSESEYDWYIQISNHLGAGRSTYGQYFFVGH